MSMLQKKRRLPAQVRTAVLFVISFAAGALLSDASMAGTASFADIAAAGAVPLPCSAAVFTGGLLRSIVSGNVGRNTVRLTAMLLTFIVRMFMDQPDEPKRCGIITAAAAAAAGTGVSALIGELPYKLPFYLFYGAVSGFAAYAGSAAAQSCRRQKLLRLTGVYGAAYGVVYTLIITSLCALRKGFFDPGITLGAAVTLFAAFYYSRQGGVLCGALTVCGAFLFSPDAGMNAALLPVTGLLTGCLRKQRISISAAFFLLASFILNILSGLPDTLSDSSMTGLVGIAAGTVIFIAAAPYYSDKWIAAGDGGEAELLPAMTASRTGFLSSAIEGISASPEKSGKTDTAESCTMPREEVCGSCWKDPICRSSVESPRVDRGFALLEALPEISAETFPHELDRCIRRESLMHAFEASRRRRASDRLMELRKSDIRSVTEQQLRLTGELLRTPAVSGEERFSMPVSRITAGKLERHGIMADSVYAWYNSRSRLIIELYLPKDSAPENSSRICDLISDELGIVLECSSRSSSGEQVRLILAEPPEFGADICISSRSADPSAACGDTVLTFEDGSGKIYAVLSDGMGTGNAASEESRAAASLFRDLVTGGVSVMSAIAVTNSVMQARSEDENFATLDIACTDLDNGGIRIVKSGAAATLLYHGGNVMKIAASTFPVGINPEAEAFSGDYSFTEGDTAIMFSDGVSESEYLFIKELLMNMDQQGQSLSSVVEEICRKAEMFSPSSRCDDVTVMGIRMYRR